MTKTTMTIRLLALACATAGIWAGNAWAASPTPADARHRHAQPTRDTADKAVVDVSGAWVRATVPGQSGTGGFMSLRSKAGALQLVGFSTPVAGSAELHEMAMDGNVMRMRPVLSLALPADQAVELKPGGHHLMLMDLKQPLKTGASVPVVLKLKTPEGLEVSQQISVPVLSAAPSGASAAGAHEHPDHRH